jgi:hypothetical protein
MKEPGAGNEDMTRKVAWFPGSFLLVYVNVPRIRVANYPLVCL